ncbi:MAG: SDR family NAD(P)-dependent oxidoreductase [Geminicoccaceae bacterium]
MDLGLKGLRAIVTGGTKGIGRRAADILADEGCHVSVCSRHAAEVKDCVAALEKKGVKAHGAALDVADKAALEAWVASAAAELAASTSSSPMSRRWPAPAPRRPGSSSSRST